MTQARLHHALDDARILLIGYGSQGRAHALNLRDSGLSVAVFTRPGPSRDRAREDGFAPADASAVGEADLIALLAPDMAQPALYRELIAAQAKPGAALLFAHGFNIHFGEIEPRPDLDVILVAPKGPGASCAGSSSRAAACLACSLSIRTPPGRRARA